MSRQIISFVLLLPFFLSAQDVVINEVMASNLLTVIDEDGDTSDWIELYNAGDVTVNLSGFAVSDDSTELQKWQFANSALDPGQHLLVFASGKDRKKIISHWETVISEGDIWKYKIADASIPTNWIDRSYDDSSWNEGPSGFGYGDGDDNTDLQNQSPFPSVFIRKNFNVDNLNSIVKSVLHIDYDDGFVAYINGTEIARSGIGVVGDQPAWNAFAENREALMYSGGVPQKFEMDWIKDILNEGVNTIAIQVHNTISTSSDMSLIPFLSFGLSEIPVNAAGSLEILGFSLLQSFLHTNFKISATGEIIFFCDSSGSIIDEIAVPASNSDISYGRTADGSLPWIFQLASPGSNNTGEEFVGFADTISVSLSAGFYQSPISVELYADESRIFYTLDGSDPDSNSSEYSSPISIDNTTILKAISLKEDYFPGPVIYNTYFINEETDLPVLSLTSDPFDLFDPDSGIYVDGPGWTAPNPHFGANYWMDWERQAHVEFFDDDKQLGFSEGCGITIFGGWSRAFDQRSFSIKFKAKYGTSKLNYQLFPNLDIVEYQSFLLRNSGNDWGATLMRDAVMQTIVKDVDIDYLEYRPAVVFINGEYWGIYNMREKISEHYVAAHHDVDKDNIDMLENNRGIIHGDSENYNQFIAYLEDNDMQAAEAYYYLDSQIEIDETINYYISQIYFNNTDWPGNNLKYWRSRDNGKWRWILFDTDFGFSLYNYYGYLGNTLEFALDPDQSGWPNPAWSTLMLRKLLENPTFKSKFINRFADLLNSAFDADRVKNIILQLNTHIINEIPKHLARWGQDEINRNNHIERMNIFADNRKINMRSFISQQFDLNGTRLITLDASSGGQIKINTMYLDTAALPWSGEYFFNNPITVKAIANNGYKFDGWSGTISSEDVSLALFVNTTTNLIANFSIDTRAAKEIVINEINYNSSDLFNSGDWIELYNRSNKSINLSDWIFTDGETDHIYNLPPGVILDPGQYLVLVENESAFTSRFPNVSNYIGEMDFGLSGAGESIKLLDEEGQFMDSLTYDDLAPWPTAAAGFGATLELVDPSSDNSIAENWRASEGNGSPGFANSVLSSLVKTKNEKSPEKFLLFQNYPNPFNSTTKIRFQLEKNYNVRFKVFDINGKIVREIAGKKYDAGEYFYTIKFANNLASGVYFYQVLLDEAVVYTKKMILIR